jgi:hypothetical protein
MKVLFLVYILFCVYLTVSGRHLYSANSKRSLDTQINNDTSIQLSNDTDIQPRNGSDIQLNYENPIQLNNVTTIQVNSEPTKAPRSAFKCPGCCAVGVNSEGESICACDLSICTCESDFNCSCPKNCGCKTDTNGNIVCIGK